MTILVDLHQCFTSVIMNIFPPYIQFKCYSNLCLLLVFLQLCTYEKSLTLASPLFPFFCSLKTAVRFPPDFSLLGWTMPGTSASAGYILAYADPYIFSLLCHEDTPLTHVQLVFHQQLSSNQLHQQSWKVLSNPLGDYILLPSVCRHKLEQEGREFVDASFPILWSSFLCFAPKPVWSLAQAAKPKLFLSS